jgi:FMN phosphatase YigB (HAD superfamily)
MMINIYVDCDGTLVKYSTARFRVRVEAGVNQGLTDLEAWLDAAEVIPRPLNYRLLRWLKNLPKDKYRLILWTNRNPGLIDATMRNLGKWAEIFDDFSFNGTGSAMSNKYGLMDGFVIDDEPRYVRCGSIGGLQVVW